MSTNNEAAAAAAKNLNEPAAALAEASAPAPALALEADLASLQRLVNKFDRAENLIAETLALKARLEEEISGVLASGDSLSDKIAERVVLKRTQLEMVPAKLAKLEQSRDELQAKISEAFAPCMAAFERDLAGISQTIYKRIEFFVRCIGVEKTPFVENAIGVLVQHSSLCHAAAAPLSAIRFALQTRNAVEAARILLKRSCETESVREEAYRIATTAA